MEEKSYNPKNLSQISHPLADQKFNKKILKTIKKASKSKNIKRGVKEVVKSIKKGDKGIVIIAGDISPIDVVSHVPVLCEDADIPYIYVLSKDDLGSAVSTKRPTSMVMIKKSKSDDEEYNEKFEQCKSEIQGLPLLPSIAN